MTKKHHADAALIKTLGGPSQLAQSLGFKQHGAQRVHNWTKRGIPAAVKLNRPDLFLKISPISQSFN